MGVRYTGAKVQRLEDERLLIGQGCFVDDIAREGMLHVAFVRSEHAHANIKDIGTAEALALDGIHGVFTHQDFAGLCDLKRMNQLYPAPAIEQDITQYPIAGKEVCYVGEIVAVVVADNRAIAEDAIETIIVEYETLPAIVDCRQALDPDAPMAHGSSPNNLVGELRTAYGEIDDAFDGAEHVFTRSFLQHRGGCHAMECRGVVAEYETTSNTFAVWSSTQCPYLVRRSLADYIGEAEERIRVIAPDVGGGFGPKAGFYPEEIIVPLLARSLNCPVKWIEDRHEHFVATTTQRDQHWDVEVACDANGVIRGIRGNVTHENGAYVPYGFLLPFTSLSPLPGPYAVPAVDVSLKIVFTNTTPNTPVRGAGRPYGIYAVERLIETISRNLKIDPAEVRRRNYVREEQMPYETGALLRDGSPVKYDSGNYQSCLEKALALADYTSFKKRKSEAKDEDRYIGIGIASYIEDTGLGPYEGTTVRVQPNGQVLVRSGSASQGQGHHTFIAQIVAERLEVRMEDIVFESGDTGKFPHGVGTIGSRIAANVGPSAHDAANTVREKAIRLASEELEASEKDLEISNGNVHVKGVQDLSISLGNIARILSPMAGGKLPSGFLPSLEATSYAGSTGSPIANGTNVAEVEVDILTGNVKLLKYSVAHDCGTMINPNIVEGQIIGGVVHGIGNALFERMIYSEAGQPLTNTYADYLLPLATEMPNIEIVHEESPSPLNGLGIKGAGEGGTIPATAAVIAAVENALEEFNIEIDYYPINPQHLTELIDG
ncbi:MAG TPA: xanthine dehydrogenase family protein molybdopterin-binding subunit [Rhodospirillales bacterium]|nr:xanthine dehydrogenase family protein molybdopterin-binding subunit [Rhodospirillales bacterium]